MDEIYSWIKNILIFMIINNIIMNLLGNKSYKKYVSIVSGMILVLIVISPLIKLLKLEDSLNYNLQADEFSIEASDFKNDVSRIEEKQRDEIFAEYKGKIRSQVKELLSEEMVNLESFEVTLDMDPNSNTFGQILSMNIKANVKKDSKNDSKKKSSNGLTIDDIKISQIIIGKSSVNTDQVAPSPMEIKLKSKLADFYNIEQGNINISVQGE